ncbi:MAG: class I SAM-dependent methyltransferase [Myxococcota bacterium]|nr:class I SAM-dependent methyltransferase [Myxococcota bacterium]
MALLRRVVRPMERRRAAPLRILDLGGGLGWLSYRLASRGHDAAAIDLTINDFDGLGAHRHYPRRFLAVQAEFDRLPFTGCTADLVIYNASFHYSVDLLATMREGFRVLAPGGRLVIMDSPLYRDSSSGRAMLRERRNWFFEQTGMGAPALECKGFLTFDALATLEERLHLSMTVFQPWYGVRWFLRPWVARLFARREPARFALIVCHRLGE